MKKQQSQYKKGKNERQSQSKKQSNPTPQASKKDFIGSLDVFFDKNLSRIFIISLLLTIILGAYLFDVKISEGGDDSSYILYAKQFIQGIAFPSWHGSFYPIFLSLPYLIFRLNVILLKAISFLFIVGHLVFFYLALRNRISATFLALIMLITAVNSQLLYFASQTYSEALFLFLQSLTFYIFLKINDGINTKPYLLKDTWGQWLSFGFVILLFGTTRNVGYGLLFAIILYLLINKNYKPALFSILSYLVFAIPYNLYKGIVWGIYPGGAGGGRLEVILYKNPYNKAAGTEDFAGMITRVIENSKIYLSRYFFSIIGLKDPSSTTTNGFLTFLLYAIFIIALLYAIRKSKIYTLISLYLLFSIAITFVTLQQSWGQLRMILVYVPLILILCSWGIYQLSKNKNLRILQSLLFLLLLFVFFKTFGQTIKKARANQAVLTKNLQGNLYYGLTPDWTNFLKMSEWVGKNIPDSVSVASRKPSMSFIYSKGREFYPIYKMPVENGDSLMNKIKNRHSDICIFNLNEFNTKKVPFATQAGIRHTAVAFMGQSSDVFGLFELKEEYSNYFINTLTQFGISYYLNTDTFMNKLHINKEPVYGVEPDSLVSKLKKNSVEYVIVGSLRINPKMKTARTINTVQRYLFYIELKYPGLFTLVHQIGANDNEPAKLLKINYKMFDL